MNSRSPQQAREQAAEYLGFTASTTIRAGGQDYEIPNPALLDDDQQERYNELQFELETWDRDRDLLDDNGNVLVRGQLKTPYRKGGKLVKPPYAVQLAIALWGEDRYKSYKAAGGIANQILVEWNLMNRQFEERLTRDPKSAGSTEDLEDGSD